MGELKYNPIMVAMDVHSMSLFEEQLEGLSPYVGTFKVGLEAMTKFGAQGLVDKIHNQGSDVFLDGKFCDIPNTVGKASAVVADMGAAYFNVHASCGPKSIEAAAKVKGDSKLLVVTVLTSIDEVTCQNIFGDDTQSRVHLFAKMALECGADGLVCSALELEMLNEDPQLKPLLKVCPGIRPKSTSQGDQKRVMTPEEAMHQGADHLVIGRPIMEAKDPAQAAKNILDGLNT